MCCGDVQQAVHRKPHRAMVSMPAVGRQVRVEINSRPRLGRLHRRRAGVRRRPFSRSGGHGGLRRAARRERHPAYEGACRKSGWSGRLRAGGLLQARAAVSAGCPEACSDAAFGCHRRRLRGRGSRSAWAWEASARGARHAGHRRRQDVVCPSDARHRGQAWRFEEGSLRHGGRLRPEGGSGARPCHGRRIPHSRYAEARACVVPDGTSERSQAAWGLPDQPCGAERNG